MDSLRHPAILAILAALPAVACWWRARVLMHAVADPALAERLAAFRQRRAAVAAGAVTALVALRPPALIWTLPLLFVLLLAASYPLRRALFSETWTFPQYAEFFIRLTTGTLGFWILLAATPAITVAVDGWAIPALLSLVLLAWELRYGVVLRRLLRARSLENEELRQRLERLRLQCALPPIRFEQVPVPGGVVANALALPSTGESAVVFSTTLLERLTADEVEAIGAHELAHIEHYNRTRLWQLRAVTVALIATSAFAAPLARPWLPTLANLLPYAWFIALPIGLALRGSARQQHETASDLRAAALTDNPEALISALTKLHAIGRVPRRSDAEQERHATHPSLARRIQALRHAAGAVAAPLTTASTFTSADGAWTIVFDPDRLTWRDGDAVSFSAAYARLSELRIQPKSSEEVRLIIADADRRRWEIALQAADVAHVQAILDVVDPSLSASSTPSRQALPLLARLATMVLALSALAMAQWAAALIALAGAVRPAPALLASGGAAVAIAAALAWRSAPDAPAYHALAIMMCVDAIAVILIAWRQRGTTAPMPRWWMFTLGAGTAMSWAVLILSMPSADGLALHRAAFQWSAAAVWPVALAAALLFVPARRARLAAVPLVCLAVGIAHAGSTQFLDRFGGDPLLVNAPLPVLRTIVSSPVLDVSVPLDAGTLSVSADGQLVALAVHGEHEQSYRIGTPADPLTAIDADDVAFLGGGRALTLKHDARRAVLRDVSVDTGVSLEHVIEDAYVVRIITHEDTGAWTAFGWTSDENLIELQGRAGQADTSARRWPLGAESASVSDLLTPIGASAAGPLMLRAHYDHNALVRAGVWWRVAPLLAASALQAGGDVWVADSSSPEGHIRLRSRLEVACDGNLSGVSPVCTAFDGHRTRLVALDAAGDAVHVRPLLELPGRFDGGASAANGWIGGWWRGRPVAVRWGSREVFQLDVHDGVAIQLAIAAQHIAALVYDRGEPRLRLYPFEP